MDDLFPAAHDLVAEDQHEVAGAPHAERGLDGGLLLGDHRDARLGYARGEEGLGDEAWDLVAVAAAQRVVAAADVVVEVAGHRARDVADVVVAPVARTGNDDDAPAGDVEAFGELRHGLDRVRVVAVVQDDLERMLIEDVGAARRLEEGRVEGAEALTDRLELDPHGEGHRRGEHGVVHVVERAPFHGRRDQVRPQQRDVRALVVDRDHLAVHAALERDGPPAGADVLADEGVRGVHGHVTEALGIGVRRHLEAERIVGVEHRGVARDLDHHALHLGQVLERVDALHAEVVGADVEHRAHVHVARAHAGAQQATARDLEHGDVDRRVAQHGARSDGARHVALDGALAVDVDAVGGGEPRGEPAHLADMREHARGGRLAVGARDGGDRHRGHRAHGEEHVDHRCRDVARPSFARRRVHAEPRGRIHLADRAAGLAVRLRDVVAEKVHAAYIEPDRLDRAHGHLGVVGVDHVGHVGRGTAGGEVGGGSQVHDLAGRWHGVLGVTLLLEQSQGLRVELEPREDLLVPDATARVLVHDHDQLSDGPLAVPDHVAGRAARGRDEHAVHHEQPVVVARDETLHEHRTRDLLRHGECGADRLLGVEMDRDRASVVAVVRLDHHRVADPARGARGCVGALHQLLLGDRKTDHGEDLVRLLLVARELHRDVRGASGDGRLDALLEASIAQLDQRLAVEPDPRDVARLGGLHDRRRARSECAALREADERVALPREVERVGLLACAQRFGQERVDEPDRELRRLEPFVLVLVLEDHVVDARLVGAARLAEGDPYSCDVLQFDRDMLEHMPEPGALVLGHAADEATRLAVRTAVLVQPGQSGEQAVDERAAEPRGGPLLERAEVELEADDREVRVERGADIDRTFEDPHVLRCL